MGSKVVVLACSACLLTAALGCNADALMFLPTGDLAAVSDAASSLDLAAPTDLVAVEPTCGDMRGLQAGAFWPMGGYCPTRVRRSPTRGARSFTTRWTVALPRTEFDWEPAIDKDGVIYLVGAESIHAIDGATGMPRWTIQPRPPCWGTPAIAADGTLFVGCGDGLHAVDPASGDDRLVLPTACTVGSPVIAGDGTVYFGCDRPAQVFAVRAGQQVWRYDTGGLDVYGPATDGTGTLYLVSHDDAPGSSVHAIDAETGTPRWRRSLGVRAFTEPVLGSGDAIVVPTIGSVLYLARDSGDVLWNFLPTGDAKAFSHAAVGADGTAYVIADDGLLVALDHRMRQVRWQSPGNLRSFAPTIDGDGGLYVVEAKQDQLRDGATGALTAAFGTASDLWAPVIGKDGLLVAVTSAGSLVGIGP